MHKAAVLERLLIMLCAEAKPLLAATACAYLHILYRTSYRARAQVNRQCIFEVRCGGAANHMYHALCKGGNYWEMETVELLVASSV